MSTLAATSLTLADWAKRLDPGGKVDTIVPLLSQTNEILKDMQWVEGNLPTGHKTTLRTSLPTPTWRLLYQGVAPAKSTTAQIVDTTGMLEAYSSVDLALLELNGNSKDFRLSEDMAFMEAMNQAMATTLFYGNQRTNPERFTGLAPRYNTVTAATNASAANVIDAGGTGSDNTSIWIIVWGTNTCHGIFPKGSLAGLQVKDLGQQPAYDGSNNRYEAQMTHFVWKPGLTVRDWRYIVRICNIDVSDLAGNTPANLINAIVRGIYRLPTQPSGAGPVQSIGEGGEPGLSAGTTVIYCNRTVATYLHLQTLNKTNALITLDQAAGGKPVLRFLGIPVRISDAILNTEARIT